MKFIILFSLFYFTNFTAKSQNNVNAVCTSCDSVIRNHCGEYRVVKYEKIVKRKLKKDLRTIKTIESYLLDTGSSNLVIDSRYKVVYLPDLIDSVRTKVRIIRLNYFEVYVNEFSFKQQCIRYAGIISKNTCKCGLNNQYDLVSTFDPRLVKPILKQRKAKYAFLSCSAVYLNFIGLIIPPKQLVKPIEIYENILDPRKRIDDFIKNRR